MFRSVEVQRKLALLRSCTAVGYELSPSAPAPTSCITAARWIIDSSPIVFGGPDLELGQVKSDFQLKS